MIYAKFNYIEKKLNLEQKYCFIVIENINFFYKIVEGIKEDIDSIVMFYDHNYEQLFLEKKIEIISDYFNIDCSKNKYLFDYLKKIKFIESTNVKLIMNDIFDKVDNLIEEIKINNIMDLDYDDNIDLEYLLKSIGISFNNSKDRKEKLINYCRILYEIYKKDIFIFINLNMYYSEEDIILILDQLYLLGMKCINISTNCNNLFKSNIFNKIIIDKDLCEIYN